MRSQNAKGNKSLAWAIAGGLAIAVLLAAIFITMSGGPEWFRESKAGDLAAPAASEGGRTEEIFKRGEASPEIAAWRKEIDDAGIEDFPALMRKAMLIADASMRKAVLGELIGKWLNVSVPTFIAFVDEMEVNEDEGDSIWKILAPALAEALPKLNDEAAAVPGLSEIVRRLVAYYAQTDPRLALAWAREWLLDDLLQSSLAMIAGELVKASPEEAYGVLAEISSPPRRVDALLDMGMVLGAKNADDAIRWATNLENPAERPYAMKSVLSSMSAGKPDRAAVELSRFQEALQAEYEKTLAEDSAALGISAAAGEFNGEPVSPADLENLPSKIHPLMLLLEDASVVVAESYGASDPAKALQWAESLPEGSRLKREAMSGLLLGWAQKKPADAFEYYTRHALENPAPMEGIFEAWAAKDPNEAIRHAERLSLPIQRATAISGIVSGWLEHAEDPKVVEAWVDQLPSAKERDAASMQIIDATSYDQPKAAWERAERISDPWKRREAMESAFASLAESDPETARALLNSAKLSAKESETLTRMLDAVTVAAAN